MPQQYSVSVFKSLVCCFHRTGRDLGSLLVLPPAQGRSLITSQSSGCLVYFENLQEWSIHNPWRQVILLINCFHCWYFQVISLFDRLPTRTSCPTFWWPREQVNPLFCMTASQVLEDSYHVPLILLFYHLSYDLASRHFITFLAPLGIFFSISTSFSLSWWSELDMDIVFQVCFKAVLSLLFAFILSIWWCTLGLHWLFWHLHHTAGSFLSGGLLGQLDPSHSY